MNTTLSTLSVQRLNHAVNQVVNAMPGSSPSVTTESDQLNVSADKSSASLTNPAMSSVGGSVVSLQPPQPFMVSLDVTDHPLVPSHPASDVTVISGFPVPDVQSFSALKPKKLAPCPGRKSRIISSVRTLRRLQPKPPRQVLTPPYHPSTAVLPSSIPIIHMPSVSRPPIQFPPPPPQSISDHLPVLGNAPGSSYMTCYLPPPAPPSGSGPTTSAPHLQLVGPPHMNVLPPTGPLSPGTTQLLQSAIDAEAMDSEYNDSSDTLAPMSSLLSMISHNSTSHAHAMLSHDETHDDESVLHADFNDERLIDTDDTTMQCLQESMSPSQEHIDGLPSPPQCPTPNSSPDTSNSTHEIVVVDFIQERDESEASSILGDSEDAVLAKTTNSATPVSSIAATLAPPDGSQGYQSAVTAAFDFVLPQEPVTATEPTEVDPTIFDFVLHQEPVTASEPTEVDPTSNMMLVRAANIPVYPALDGPPTNNGRYCVDCNKMYRGDGGCTSHSSNYSILPDSPIPSRARLSIPPQLTLRAISHQTTPNYMGVISMENISSHTLFGPLLGTKTTKEQLERPTETAYVWELFDDGRQSQVLDCRDEDLSNWLMFVKRARTTDEQNVMVYQQLDDIFFVTCKDVGPGTELLYWYARDYAKMLGVAWRPEDFFKCPTCGKQFPDMNSVKQHLRYTHPDQARRNRRCHQCGHAFSCASKLKTHMLSHMGVKPHKCQYCGKQFTDGSNLRMHLRLHTDERNFTCTLCARSFRQKAHMEMHQLTHTGEKGLQCRFCERMFARASDVKQHEYMHAGEKTFQCTHDNCTKVFWKMQNFKRHMNTHLGVREHTCAKCSRSFATSYHMKRHAGVCKGPKPNTELNAQTGAELGLSIAKRRIQKRNAVKFIETETTWECPI